MDRDELVRRHAELVDRTAPWSASNFHLGHGVYTMAAGHFGLAERNVQRITQLISDHARREFEGMRVLDLGSYEGAFAVELAMRGAQVVAVEGREAHAEKILFARDALGLDALDVRHGDIRDISPEAFGEFDVVLCLGVLYHLEAQDAVGLVRSVAACTRSLAIFETQTSLSAARSVTVEGVEYRGRDYEENLADPGASIDNQRSFWLTRPSLVRALGEAGFTSVSEVLAPCIPALAAFRDHVTLVAIKGEPMTPVSLPELQAPRWSVPESLPRLAHPAQGLRHRLIERWHRARGRGLADVFKMPVE